MRRPEATSAETVETRVHRWFATGFLVLCCAYAVVEGCRMFGDYRDQIKVRTTMRDLREVAVAIESYRAATSSYPYYSGPAERLAPMLVPTYVKVLPNRDPWGQSYQIVSTASEYSVTSFAEDRVPDSDAPHDVGFNGGTTDLGADIIFSTGSFVQFPVSRGGC